MNVCKKAAFWRLERHAGRLLLGVECGALQCYESHVSQDRCEMALHLEANLLEYKPCYHPIWFLFASKLIMNDTSCTIGGFSTEPYFISETQVGSDSHRICSGPLTTFIELHMWRSNEYCYAKVSTTSAQIRAVRLSLASLSGKGTSNALGTTRAVSTSF